jgi:hypothetical protein
MISLLKKMYLPLFALLLSGCMASSSSSIGVNCGPSANKPIWERPLDCQGH